MEARLVAYYRVSTEKQGRSGLGLEAQVADVARYAALAGATVVAAYTEVETARKDELHNRPQLVAALEHARASQAVLVIAKLDRLARSVYAKELIKRGGVPFVCCDNPHANELTIDILAAVAADESRRTSERTRAAMTAAKARGRRFGTPANLGGEAAAKGRALGASAVRRNARRAYAHVAPRIAELIAQGLSNAQIAEALNAQGYVTRRNCAWTGVQVSRVLSRTALA